ncbi:hypothetical protein LMG6871_04838 [Ralstonia edaphis]|nr:hypothetical protein LMG6871_04838 [Ralstonia sp. LMG 6871]
MLMATVCINTFPVPDSVAPSFASNGGVSSCSHAMTISEPHSAMMAPDAPTLTVMLASA